MFKPSLIVSMEATRGQGQSFNRQAMNSVKNLLDKTATLTSLRLVKLL